MELPPEHKRVPIVPSPMGELTIEYHSDGFTNTIVLAIPGRP